MAKKSKKQVRKVTRAAVSNGMRPSVSETNAVMSSVSRTSSTDFNPDYSQTIKDLKRIGFLASTFFVVLVIISFFLR